VVQVRIGTDRLEVDNQRWFSVPVREAVRVLCIEGSPDAARYVAMALNPDRSPSSPVQPLVQPESALLEIPLAQYDCVFLCNIGRFGGNEAAVLRDYLEEGGAVVLFLGDRVQTDSYNELLGPNATQGGILPGKLNPAVAIGQYSFDPLEYRDPIVAPFRGNERAGLLTTPVWKYIPLDVAAVPEAKVALGFDTGDPAIAERSVGAGKVIVMCTAASDRSLDRTTTPPTPWSVQCAWPSFPPLVQRILLSATSRRDRQRNRLVGEPIESQAFSPRTSSSTVVVVTPDGERERVTYSEASDDGWAYVNTFRRGLYSVQAGGSAENVQLFCVNVNPVESQLDRLESDSLPSQFGSREELTSIDEPGADLRRPTQLFRYIFFAVMILLLSESGLAWLFGRTST
jgi:hypothetical protein